MLSQRQSQILELIKLGSSNKDIAEQLGLTTGTVKQHVHALFRKLGVTNRTMAVARAGALAAAYARRPAPQEQHYSRRLVTVVVIEPRPQVARNVRDMAQIAASIELLHARLGRLALAFDARAEPLPGGSVAVWFGQPVAHGDDAERAIAFVRTTLRHAAPLEGVACALGVGTAPELVGEGERHATAYHRALRLAAQLAALAEPGAPLACEQTARLAQLGFPDEPSRAPAGTVVVGAGQPPGAAPVSQWGGLPFLVDVVRALRERRCQWLAVESWPPHAGTRLMDALAERLAAARLRVQKLWMPAPSGVNTVAQQLAWQLYPQAPEPVQASVADTLASAASQGPAALIAYGIDALRVLKESLGERGIERLRSLQLIVVAAAMQRAGAPQTVVRLLGSHPGAAPFVRVLRFETSEGSAVAPDGIRPDVQAVLDALSPQARALARLAAQREAADLAGVARALGLAEPDVRARCRELQAWGLLCERDDRVEFRDAATAAAVRASLAAAAA